MVREPEIPVYLVQLWLCDPCLDGEGEQCHTPGCSLWMHNAPRPGLRGSQGVTILGPALEPFMTPAEWQARTAAGGRAAYETWRAAVPEITCNVPGGPWDELPEAVQAGFNAVAAREPDAADGKTRAQLVPLAMLSDQEKAAALVKAAQFYDYEHYRDSGERGGSWGSVPAAQVLRLLVGALGAMEFEPQPVPGTEAAR